MKYKDCIHCEHFFECEYKPKEGCLHFKERKEKEDGKVSQQEG